MYIVTGGAGFIGSGCVWKLNTLGINDIVVVDNLGCSEKWKNLVNLRYTDYFHKNDFIKMVVTDSIPWDVQGVIHMGACSSTTESDADYLMENNFKYTMRLCEWCLAKNIRFINASSAATYGDGGKGFSDREDIKKLRPLNMYGYTKQLFDIWAEKNNLLNSIVCLKFFNVYGPNEYHKGDMMSVICKAYSQIQETGKLKLFKSYKPEYPDGGQKRDFIYLKDCLEVIADLLEKPAVNGIFNVGTGLANTWNDLAHAVFAAMGKEPQIEYIDMPEGLREKYQYFTEADMQKLQSQGILTEPTSLHDGAGDYVRNYLARDGAYLEP